MELDLSQTAAAPYIDDFNEDVDFEVQEKSAEGGGDGTELGKEKDGRPRLIRVKCLSRLVSHVQAPLREMTGATREGQLPAEEGWVRH